MTTEIKKRGRPPGTGKWKGEPTVAIRVPARIIPEVQRLMDGEQVQSGNEIKELLSEYRERSNNSPRWHFARELIAKLEKIV
jgi:hypothetical protein